MRAGWFVVLLAVAACGKSKAVCKAEVEQLMTFLRSFDHEGSMFYIGDKANLVQREGLPAPRELAPVVMLDAKQTIYQGRVVDVVQLAEALAAANRKIRDDIELGRAPKSMNPQVLYFQISADTTWDRVATAVQAGADTEFTRPSFVFATPNTAVPPPRTWVDDKFAEIRRRADQDGSSIASGLGDITRGIVKSCPALIEVYGSVGGASDAAGHLIEGTGPALLQCKCDVDMPALRSVMWFVFANPHPTGVLEIELDPTAQQRLELPATTPWAEASKKLTPGMKTGLAVN